MVRLNPGVIAVLFGNRARLFCSHRHRHRLPLRPRKSTTRTTSGQDDPDQQARFARI